jgi:Raf kinase inhibitor-like YbhB/YbcL family protein
MVATQIVLGGFMAFVLESPAFAHEGAIPREHTCDGDDESPPLVWTGAPAGTKSFALIVDDPDAPDPAAPKRVFVHWVIVDIPPEVQALESGASERSLPRGAREGNNDMNRTRYGGPCPPIGRHRYFHKLYALDTALPDLTSPTKGELLNAMDGHVLAQAELMGTYQRQS